MKEQRSNEKELLAAILTGTGIGALTAQEPRRSANSAISEAIRTTVCEKFEEDRRQNDGFGAW